MDSTISQAVYTPEAHRRRTGEYINIQFRIESITKSDVDRLMDIKLSAFREDPLFGPLCRAANAPSCRPDARKRLWKEWTEDPTLEIVKCTNTSTGIIVGFAQWNVYKDGRMEKSQKVEHKTSRHEGRNKEVFANFLREVSAVRRKVWAGRPYFCRFDFHLPLPFDKRIQLTNVLLVCSLLCVHKDYQRRGAGTLLTSWGLDRARGLGMPVYLEANPMAYPLYMRLGFFQVGIITIKAEDWDSDHDRNYPALVRMPPSEDQFEPCIRISGITDGNQTLAPESVA